MNLHQFSEIMFMTQDAQDMLITGNAEAYQTLHNLHGSLSIQIIIFMHYV